MRNIGTLKALDKRIIALSIVMLIALALSFVFKPSNKMSAERNNVSFEKLVPKSFHEWEIDASSNGLLVDPEVKSKLDSVYSQTVSRTYIDQAGNRIMLSIAYGGDQEEVMQVHKPEVCYTAQGFTVTKNGTAAIITDKGTIIANQLLTKQAERVEPVTYWITIGKSIALNGLQWRWERIKYGLTGELPDGLLFRVSSMGIDNKKQYALQQKFIKELFSFLDDKDAKHLIGEQRT